MVLEWNHCSGRCSTGTQVYLEQVEAGSAVGGRDGGGGKKMRQKEIFFRTEGGRGPQKTPRIVEGSCADDREVQQISMSPPTAVGALSSFNSFFIIFHQVATL